MPNAADLICFSHLRWNFVFQRPQHLMTRCAKARRVFFFEEPTFGQIDCSSLKAERSGAVTVLTPQLPDGLSGWEVIAALRSLLDRFMASRRIQRYCLWYYTPMAVDFTAHLSPTAVIYDCMDELSAFKGAPPAIKEREQTLLAKASLVLTGGHSLFEAKRQSHHNIHPFPSSVDVEHFAQARLAPPCPIDQAALPAPRLGFFGVIDERMDLTLLDQVASLRPEWQIVLVGPIVKIDPNTLPRRPNIHYLGGKSYDELPRYVSGWDVALLPFARNESTRFISPTKTPEYLAAGRPVVSTSIRDVVRPYEALQLVRIADDAPGFVAACDAAMAEDATLRVSRADAFLRHTSWDDTWSQISALVDEVESTAPAPTTRVGDATATV